MVKEIGIGADGFTKYSDPPPTPHGKRIWKLDLRDDPTDEHVKLGNGPEGAQFLSCGFHRGAFTVWLICDPSAPIRQYDFMVIQTGATINPDWSLGLCLGRVELEITMGMPDAPVHHARPPKRIQAYHVFTRREDSGERGYMDIKEGPLEINLQLPSSLQDDGR